MAPRITIQGKVQPKQSILLDKFIEMEDIHGVFHEEFPVGIKRAYRLINPKQNENFAIHKRLENTNYKFGSYKNDIELLKDSKYIQIRLS